MTLYEAAREVTNTLKDAGYEAFFVGGCVRDLLLGREPKDYDVTTNALPEQVTALFSKTTPVGAAFGVVVVMVGDAQIEVATYRSDGQYSDTRRPDTVSYSSTAKEDVVRRDFTINGLLLSADAGVRPVDDAVIDYVNGCADLRAKVIRCIGDPNARFGEDALRMLRAVRFAAQLGFDIDPGTEEAIRSKAGTLANVSRERVAAELFRIVSASYPVKGLVPLASTGLLRYALPGLTENDFAAAVRRFDEFNGFPLSAYGDPLKGMSMLLVDSGASCALSTCVNLKLSGDQRIAIAGAVQCLPEIGLEGRTLAQMKKFARNPGLRIAADLFRQNAALVDYVAIRQSVIVERMRKFTPNDLRPKPLVTGDDLIAMGLTPSPLFTIVLGAVEDEQLNETLTDRDAALAFARALAEKEGYHVSIS